MGVLFILGLLLFISVILPWINWARISSLKTDLENLREEVALLRAGELKANISQGRIYTDHTPQAYEKKSSSEFLNVLGAADSINQEHVSVMSQPEENMVEETVYETPLLQKSGMEFNLGAKLPVWIGAISLICAAYFLVKYSLESGLLGPVARISIGVVSGLAMAVAGVFISRRSQISNYERISQGLTGAGIVTLYGCLYAAVNLYGLLSPTIGFIGMCGVTVMAIISSTKIGQPIAIFALVGGLLTPALMQSDEPNSLILFIYLFVLFTGLSIVMVRNGWWLLSIFSLLGVFGWTTLWFNTAFDPSESIYMLVLQTAVVATTVAMAKKYIVLQNDETSIANYYPHFLVGASIAGTALTIFVLGDKMTIGLFDWAIIGMLGSAVTLLTYFNPNIYKYGLYAIMAVHMALFAIWLDPGDVPVSSEFIVLSGSIILYCIVPQFFIQLTSRVKLWGALQLTAAGVLYSLSYYNLEINDRFLSIISIVLAILCVFQILLIYKRYDIAEKIQAQAVAMYTFAASASLSVGFALFLPDQYLSLAYAVQAGCTLWIYNKTRIDILDAVAFVLAAIFVVLQYEQILLFSALITSSLLDETPSGLIANKLLDLPFWGLGAPAIALLAGIFIRTHKNTAKAPLHFVAGVGLAAGLAAIYYLVRNIGGNVFIPNQEASFLEASIISLIIAGAGFIVLILGSEFIKKWGEFLLYIYFVRVIWFALILDNPYLDEAQAVGSIPIVNSITLTYLGATIAAFGVFYKNLLDPPKFYGVLTLAFLMAFISLTIRHAYHGDLLSHDEGMTSLELYTYSLVWLLTGIAILAYGIVKDNHIIRMASFAVISLTVLKVFLIDAGNLEGLYRVFSFLGLGVSLMVLSYFYSRFVRSNAS
jgi:uncharacterized membrane protein